LTRTQNFAIIRSLSVIRPNSEKCPIKGMPNVTHGDTYKSTYMYN